ncbi:hypothetical protein CTC_01461 [Clostridium tetani E88]|uniref:Uncharacterized protein n=1 Tax=Clostridium tetani (strain Massachusetts / E88) TaxID=212717 RepID=Q894S4_CLOTE|nr:hypothetical protein CTC_01461 [Clostridium tetani E88]
MLYKYFINIENGIKIILLIKSIVPQKRFPSYHVSLFFIENGVLYPRLLFICCGGYALNTNPITIKIKPIIQFVKIFIKYHSHKFMVMPLYHIFPYISIKSICILSMYSTKKKGT